MTGLFAFGLIIGAVITALVLWLRGRDIVVKWYDWLIGVIGLVLLVFGIWHYFGSLAENFAFAGMMGLLIFGVIGLVLMAVSWQLIARRQRAV